MIKKHLRELRVKEKDLVKSIRDLVQKDDPTCEIAYIPNLMPNERLKYIFITMEPSFGRWAKNSKDAEEKIQNGFRNFILSWEDFIFHYCISEYLSRSYFITDISKVAMKVENANLWRDEIYPKWIEFLREEIKIVGKNNCKVIFVGESVRNFLETRLQECNVLKTILHYSGQAGRQRKELPQKYPKEFQEFKEHLSSGMILNFAEYFLKQNDIPLKIRQWILRKLNNSDVKLSESRRALMFTYYKEFQGIREN
ncbi:MAG: hypothetical protein K9L76_00160 [Candidatus Omnitrophica bacterium]|nr:hypothetical protein [Candidatus Omnitrophota bacterium]